MTWGQLGAAITRQSTPQPAALAGWESRDLAQVIDQHIAWQTTGALADPLALPPLYSVVRLIAGHITQLQIGVNGGPAPDWLRNPRRYGSALDLQDIVQHVVTSMALRGAGYLLARKVGTAESWRLDALHPQSVSVQTSSSGRVALRFAVDGEAIETAPPFVSQWQRDRDYLVHIPYLVTPDHPAGCSPVTVARESLHGYMRSESQAANLLDGGTYSGGRLETDQDITRETGLRYQEAWVANRKTGRIPVLGAGLRYMNDLISPKDAMWLESRTFNAQQIAMMFGLPPDLLGMTLQGGSSSLSYSNAQDNNRRYLRNCLMSFTSQIAASLSLLLPPGRGLVEEQRVTFDYSAFVEEGSPDADSEPEA